MPPDEAAAGSSATTPWRSSASTATSPRWAERRRSLRPRPRPCRHSGRFPTEHLAAVDMVETARVVDAPADGADGPVANRQRSGTSRDGRQPVGRNPGGRRTRPRPRHRAWRRCRLVRVAVHRPAGRRVADSIEVQRRRDRVAQAGEGAALVQRRLRRTAASFRRAPTWEGVPWPSTHRGNVARNVFDGRDSGPRTRRGSRSARWRVSVRRCFASSASGSGAGPGKYTVTGASGVPLPWVSVSSMDPSVSRGGRRRRATVRVHGVTMTAALGRSSVEREGRASCLLAVPGCR